MNVLTKFDVAKSQLKSMNIDFNFLLSFILIYLLLLISVTANVSLNQPISETFSDLLLGAMENPFDVFAPVVDGIFFLPRIFAGISVLISPIYAALILSLIAIAFHAFTATYIIRKEFEDILPDIIIRALLAIFIAFGPGSLNIVGSGICIEYSVAIFLCILGVKTKGQSNHISVIFVLILGLSSHFSIVLFPLFVIRAVIFRNLNSALGLIFLLFCGALNLGPIFSTQSKFSTIAPAFANNLDFFKAVNPFNIFNKLIESTGPSTMIYFTIFVTILLVLQFLAIQRKIYKSDYLFFGIGQFAVAFMFVLIHAVARPYGIGPLSDRHAAMIFIPLILGTSIIFKNPPLLRNNFNWHKILVIVLILPAIIFSLVNRADMPQVGNSVFWSAFVEDVRSLPVGATKKFFIGPRFGEGYWGTVECSGQKTISSCYVTNANGELISSVIPKY